jgi:hypothetical protein
MLQESSSDKRPVNLSARDEVDASEHAINCKVERRNSHLGQVHIHLLTSMHPSNHSPVSDWKIQLGGKQAVNTTLPGSGVHKGSNSSDARDRDIPNLWLKSWIKSNINVKRWSH